MSFCGCKAVTRRVVPHARTSLSTVQNCSMTPGGLSSSDFKSVNIGILPSPFSFGVFQTLHCLVYTRALPPAYAHEIAPFGLPSSRVLHHEIV